LTNAAATPSSRKLKVPFLISQMLCVPVIFGNCGALVKLLLWPLAIGVRISVFFGSTRVTCVASVVTPRLMMAILI
jgi:hypothetical protein